MVLRFNDGFIWFELFFKMYMKTFDGFFFFFQFIYFVDVLPYLSLYKEKVQLSLAYRFLKRNSLKFCLILFLFRVKSTSVVSVRQKILQIRCCHYPSKYCSILGNRRGQNLEAPPEKANLL